MSEFEKDKDMNSTENENTAPAGAEESSKQQNAAAENSAAQDTAADSGAQASAAQENTGAADATEANTTYHYSYKSNSSQANAGQNEQAAYQNAQPNGGQHGAPNYGYTQPNGGQYGGYGAPNYGYGAGQYNPYGNYYAPPYGAAPGGYQNTQYSAPDAQPNRQKPENEHGKKKPKDKKERPKIKNKTVKVIAIVLACCIVIAGIGIGVAVTQSSTSNSNGSENTTNSSAQVETQDQADVATVEDDGSYTVAGVAEKCMDSCVGITIYTTSSSSVYSYGSDYSSDSSTQQASGAGSGILMLEDNGLTYVLTCAHLMSSGGSFVVTLNDGSEYDATAVGYDSQTDIGVLSIEATGLSIAEFADSSTCVVGEQVVAIGCPGGLEFMNSVTSGYISALDRPVSSSIGYDNECIQTDAAINPGNSGCALFNMQGQVIGVVSSKIASTSYEGMGFAVPSNTAVSTANSLIKVGYVEGRAKIGITYTSLSNYSNASAILSALEQYGFEDASSALVINEISSDSDLANKDVQQYDMIVAVNGEVLSSTDVLTSVLAACSPGDTITLTLARIENNTISAFEVECELIESKG
ncbi:MAG: trypsin-like peptidase domain-containing protein [Clostridiales bacterium]|nr:trypsin-like peptidase domain-containing protein [Clostridiales bacterium]